jgi:hypothetical protein
MFFVFKGSEDKGEKAPPSLKDGVARFIFMFTFSLKELGLWPGSCFQPVFDPKESKRKSSRLFSFVHLYP